MNLQKLTVKAQKAVEVAAQRAAAHSNQAIEPVHILSALLDDGAGLATSVLLKVGVNLDWISQKSEEIIDAYPKVSGAGVGGQFFSTESTALFDRALDAAAESGDEFVATEHLLLALSDDRTVGPVLDVQGADRKTLSDTIAEIRGDRTVTDRNAEERYEALEQYGRDLNGLARSGRLDPVIGRDNEIRRVMQVLMRRTKNNPVLIGEPGVGKTAIAEGIAFRIVQGDVPETLADRRIVALDMASLVAGTSFRGQFEERMKGVIDEVVRSDGEVILFIDELHTLVGAGAGEGSVDAANILKPALARGELRTIGATTLDEYRKHIEKDAALERRFQPVLVPEPSVDDTIAILRGLKERYEVHHGVRITDDAIVAAARLSDRYIGDRFLPDKAIDLIDESASRLRLEIDSMPEQLDEIERRIRRLEIEREALLREGSS